MTAKTETTITVEQAARLIFRTDSPTPPQVGEIGGLLRSGALRQSEKQNFTTTRQAVAEYLAAQELRKQEARRSRPSSENASTRARREAPPDDKRRATSRELGERKLRRVYRELLNDHFLSVIVGGRARNYSAEFQRVVFALRCLLLVLLLGVGAWTISQIKFTSKQDIVLAWLDANCTAPEVLETQPAHSRPGGKAVRVRYRHVAKDQQTQIADRIFVIGDSEVIRIVLPDEEDDALLKK